MKKSLRYFFSLKPKLINSRFFLTPLIIFSWWSTKIVDPHFQGFSRSPFFVLILEKCWDLVASTNCCEIPDHLMEGGGDFAIPLQAFEAFSSSPEKANFAAFPRSVIV